MVKKRPRTVKRPTRRQNMASPRVKVTPGEKAKLSTGRAAHPINETASTKKINSADQGAGKNNRPKRLRKWLFGTVSGIITLIVAPAIAAIIAVLVLQVWPNPPDQPTQAIFYEPWNTNISNNTNKITLSNVHVDRTIAGYCWVSSIVTTRSDAYRCMTPTTNAILDPCFAFPFNIPSALTKVACPYPDPDSITIIRLTRPLPQPSGRNASLPTEYWFIVLADGTKCLTAGGTTDFIGNKVVIGDYYYCPGVGFPLYGYPDTSGRIWTILEQRPGTAGLVPAPIARIYR